MEGPERRALRGCSGSGGARCLLCRHLILSRRFCLCSAALGNGCAQPSEAGDKGLTPDPAVHLLPDVDRATKPLWTSVSSTVKSVN